MSNLGQYHNSMHKAAFVRPHTDSSSFYERNHSHQIGIKSATFALKETQFYA